MHGLRLCLLMVDIFQNIIRQMFQSDFACCHGIEALSGGIVPDRRMPARDGATLSDAKNASCIRENDAYYVAVVRQGRMRHGTVWAIAASLDLWNKNTRLLALHQGTVMHRFTARSIVASFVLALTTVLAHAPALADLEKIRKTGTLIVAVMATPADIESVLRGDARFDSDEPPFERLPRKGWVNGMAVKKDHTDLARLLQTAVNDLFESGEMRTIFGRHGVKSAKL